MRMRQRLMIGVVTATAMVGATAGVVAAQSAPGGDDPGTENVQRPSRNGAGPAAAAAELLGMTPEEFIEQVRAGSTPVEIAASLGVDADTLVQGVVSALLARISDELPEKVAAWASGERPEGQRPEGQRSGQHRGPRVLGQAAEIIGVSVQDLVTALQEGQTIADVAAANGSSGDAVIAAAVAEAEARLAEKVAAGELTQEEADARLAEITERVTERVNSPFEFRGDGPPRGGDGSASGPTL